MIIPSSLKLSFNLLNKSFLISKTVFCARFTQSCVCNQVKRADKRYNTTSPAITFAKAPNFPGKT